MESPSSARDIEGHVIEEPEKQLESMGDLLQTDENEVIFFWFDVRILFSLHYDFYYTIFPHSLFVFHYHLQKTVF